MVEFDYATLEHRLRELAFLNSGVRIVLSDHRGVEPKTEEMRYEGRLARLRALPRPHQAPAHPEPIVVEKEQDRVVVEAALWWNDSYHENVLCFTNNIPQRDGGTHLAGFRAALTRTVNTYAAESGIAKKEKVALTGDDAREGLSCVLSVKVPDPSSPARPRTSLSPPRCAPWSKGSWLPPCRNGSRRIPAKRAPWCRRSSRRLRRARLRGKPAS